MSRQSLALASNRSGGPSPMGKEYVVVVPWVHPTEAGLPLAYTFLKVPRLMNEHIRHQAPEGLVRLDKIGNYSKGCELVSYEDAEAARERRTESLRLGVTIPAYLFGLDFKGAAVIDLPKGHSVFKALQERAQDDAVFGLSYYERAKLGLYGITITKEGDEKLRRVAFEMDHTLIKHGFIADPQACTTAIIPFPVMA